MRNSDRRRRTATILIGLVVATGLFVLGRTTGHPSSGSASTPPATQGGIADYAAGYRAGWAGGMQEGRALQQGQGLVGSDRDAATNAFDSGYRAGINDAFGGYDGGWSLEMPYLITLDSGAGGVTYRISSRTAMQAGVNYYVCADGINVCQERR